MKKKTVLALNQDVYFVLKLTSAYLSRPMTDIIEQAVIEWLVEHKEALPEGLWPKIDSLKSGR